MVVKTKNKVPRKTMQQNVVVSAENGLPISSTLSLEATNVLVAGTTALTYALPTVSTSQALGILNTYTPKYTGQLVLIDVNSTIYFIDKTSINVGAGTFDIYDSPGLIGSPATIALTSGWNIAEAKVANKLAVTATNQVNEVVFNGLDMQLSLHGTTDSVAIVDSSGDELQVNPDGSINVNLGGAGSLAVEIDAVDGDNIAIVGTEDGTPAGIQHTVKVETDGTLSRKPLTSASDSVTVTQSGTVNVAQTAPVNVTQTGTVTVAQSAPVTVQSTNLDTRPLTSATDSVTVTQAATVNVAQTAPVNVTQTGNVTVQATSLDTRPLTAPTDSVKVKGTNTNSIEPNLNGSVNVVQEALVPEHINGTVLVPGTPIIVTPTSGRPIKELLIVNPRYGLNANPKINNLLFNIDGGLVYMTLGKGGTSTLSGNFASVKVDTDVALTNFEIIVWS